MQAWLAVLVGVLIAAAIYLLLSRDGFHLLIGMMLLTSGANLGVVVAGRTAGDAPPFVPDGAERVPVELVSNPLPQAFVLTTIVIGFGVFAFIMALLVLISHRFRTLDVEGISHEPEPDSAVDPEGEAS